jgi:hypothetical protein
MLYLPDPNKNGKIDNIDRSFFFGVISTLRESETRNLVKEALDLRFKA